MKAMSAKAQATREKILHAANDLFYRHGYNATGLDRIIAEAGVAKGSFYHHFKSKEALAQAVLDWHREQAFEEIELRAVIATLPPRDALLELIRRMTARMFADNGDCHVRGCFFGNLSLEMAASSEPLRQKIQHIFTGIREVLRDLIAAGQARGEIRPELDASTTAGIILGLMEGAVLLDKTSQREEETRNAFAFIQQYLQG